MAVQLGQEGGVDRAARPANAVPVEGLEAARGRPRDGVERHVAGAVVEGDDVGDPIAHQGDVGDAADVLQRALTPRRPEQQVVDQRHQRRAFAAGGDVAHPEIAHHRTAGALGDDGRLADLQGGAQATGRARVVHGGLTVRADQVDVFELRAGSVADGARGVREGLAEQHVQVAELGGVGLREAKDSLAQWALERRAHECAHREAGGLVRPVDGAQRGVGAVGAGSREEANHQATGAIARGQQALQRIARAGAHGASAGTASGKSPTMDRSEPLWVTSSSRARAADTPRWCMTRATLARPPAFSMRRRDAPSSSPESAETMRMARAHSLALVGRTSIMRPPYVLPSSTNAAVEMALSTILVAVPALRRVEPAITSGPVSIEMTTSAGAAPSISPQVTKMVAARRKRA